MSPHHSFFPRRIAQVVSLSLGLAMVRVGFAAESSAQDSDPGVSAGNPSALVTLIHRLVERGTLSKKDSEELILLAEADAAESRAQMAMAQATLAQAAAVLARAKATAALAGAHPPAITDQMLAEASTPAPAMAEADNEPAPQPAPAPARPRAAARVKDLPPAAAAPVAVADTDAASAATEAPAMAGADSDQSAPDTAPAEPAPKPTAKVARQSAPAAPDQPAPAEGVAADDSVRVAYVPEIVKDQLREEIKQDVMAQARKENWANPRTFPEWVSKFRLFGDFRFRSEGMRFPAGNDNTGSFPNFNAINTGAPFDTSGTVFSPQFDVDQNRNRERIRARMGAEVDLGQSFSLGMRLATGNDNNPVTENQSLGAAGSGQGGDFAKYAVWLDRAFLRYELGGQPDEDLKVSFGRFDNPFMSTSAIWADGIGFDGTAVEGRFPIGEDVTPFFALGAFPVFNTDLNFATNNPAKFQSIDKWLYAAQLGSTFELGKDFSLKLGAAYYLFRNVEGQLSTPYTPLTTSDAGNTDASRPSFAQNGNTYMALRDILPSPKTQTSTGGLIDQFQYYGLASKFRVLALDTRLDINTFEPFQISVVGEYLKNVAFDAASVGAIAVNNRGTSTSLSTTGPYVGTNTAWLAGLQAGDAALKKRWDWNVSFNYRKIGSDAVIDGFTDSDFGGTLAGTNLKGFTFGGNVALSSGVWLGLHWYSATAIVGPPFKNDLFQLDLNSKF